MIKSTVYQLQLIIFIYVWKIQEKTRTMLQNLSGKKQNIQ